MPQDELREFYRRAKVYCQLSMREGHPNALAEAMLCECVPVGTDIPGVRGVMGDTGYIVPLGDAERTADAVRKALLSHKGKEARERIKNLFSLEQREKNLVKALEDIRQDRIRSHAGEGVRQ